MRLYNIGMMGMDLFPIAGLCKSPCGEDNGVFFINQAAHADLPSLALAVKI